MDSTVGGRQPSKTPTQAIESLERSERQSLAQSGFRKLRSGEKLSRDERRAVKQFESEQREKYGEQYVSECPKKTYSDRTGVQQKVLLEQSRRFGLPYHRSGKTVDLWAQLAAWHQWAADNKHLITRVIKAQQIDELLDEDDTLDFWQRELVKERALKERDGRLERERTNLPRELFHDILQEYYIEPTARRIEQLEKRDESITPKEAAGWYRQDITAFESALEILFADDDDLPEVEAADPMP